MGTFFDKNVLSFSTSDVDGTVAIGASFICIAYFLHPAVESAYQRVRAHRAWRALENRDAVEVTNYPMPTEIFGGRGSWDTARKITVLLAVFSLVSWGLELSMDLAYHKGDADILSRSPPILCEGNGCSSTWIVMSEGEFDRQREYESLSNVGKDDAKSMYNIIEKKTCRAGYVKGSIVVASWSNTVIDKLHYAPNGSDSPTTVKDLQCATDIQPKHVNITKGDKYWGSGVACESGPAMEATATEDEDAPPALILNITDTTYLIVEESSNYPSFLYSVWTTSPKDGDPFELSLEFHIAATMRLAEAVVTGIVHGNISGKYCFELVRMYSESGNQTDDESTRFEPFGEKITDENVKIENLETIQCGLEVDVKAVMFLVCLLVLTSIGVAWSLCLRSSIDMDVYDRDELIRAVSMPGAPTTSTTSPSAMRLFVRKEDTGILSVAISETADSGGGCLRMFGLGGNVVEDNHPAPVASAHTITQYNQGYGGAAVPVGSRTVWLEGVRTGMGRPFPGRRGNFVYPNSVTLGVSPVPSNACSLVATPSRGLSPLPRAPPEGPALAEGRGVSVLFDNDYSSTESGEIERGNVQESALGDVEFGGGTSSVRTVTPGVVVRGGQSAPSARLQRAHPSDAAGLGWGNRSNRNGMLGLSSGETTPEADDEGSTEVPPFLQSREHTFGPPQLSALAESTRGDE